MWDSCGNDNSDRLAILQLEAARIVTGLICYTRLDAIYRETGCKKLSTRREVKNICMFYRLNVGSFLEFLCDLIPLSVGETNNYNLRNSHNISQTTIGSGSYCYRANMLHKFGFNIQGDGLGET